MMFSHPQPLRDEDDYLPLHSLNDLLYCERRCALHRLENVWTDNAATLEGTLSHKRADKPTTWESSPGVREVHGMWLKSDRLRLVGKADVVEFRVVGQASSLPKDFDAQAVADGRLEACLTVPCPTVPYPVEYKRGKRRKWDNDDVQLCAQALCLEEMLGVEVPRGAIFHIRSKRRREVDFTEMLRSKTEAAAARLHALIAAGVTPPATLKPQCNGCSLQDVCLPGILAQSSRIRQYCQQLLSLEASES